MFETNLYTCVLVLMLTEIIVKMQSVSLHDVSLSITCRMRKQAAFVIIPKSLLFS